MKKLIHRWHDKLNMPKNDFAWHKQDVADEMEELREAKGIICKWSELSDVVYTCTRANWAGHKEICFPFSRTHLFFGSLYMFPKYTLRWRFFRVLGKKFNKDLLITEVRNPQKMEKLAVLAQKYNQDSERFIKEAKIMMKYWIFLK